MSDGKDVVFVGVDPGSVNLGFAVLVGDTITHYETIDPTHMSLAQVVAKIVSAVPKKRKEVVLSIERYVAYKGTHNSASEHILMIIGALVYEFERLNHEVLQFRAIDWKPSICKHLFLNYDFKNPSTSFDKKFSVAAAELLSGKKLKTNHEADAICLAFKGKIANELVQATTPKNG